MSIFADVPFDEPIHITVPGDPGDPRTRVPSPPGVVIHYVPELHPDDVDVGRGLPVTSVARTLIDLADEMDYGELRSVWARARTKGLLDVQAVRAARGRVEWRPSLPLVDRLIDEFSP